LYPTIPGRPHDRGIVHGILVAILASMLDDVRSYVRAGIDAMASQGTEGIPAAVAGRAQALAEQLAAFATGFFEWSGEARASLLTELKLLIEGQIQEMGVASSEEVDALRARVARLEEQFSKGRKRPASTATRSRRMPASTTRRSSPSK
jgi:hypothetical protein